MSAPERLPGAGASVGRPIELPGAGHALFTARAHGNMSSVGGERAAQAAQARERLRTLIGARRLLRGYQVHGAVVRRVSAGSQLGGEPPAGPSVPAGRADGQATLLPGCGAMVLSADCLPVALGCAGAVAMLHAGWRGLAAGVLEEGVLALRELGEGEEVHAVVGPGAGACCYEVGPEVHEALGERPQAGPSARALPIDLRAIAHRRLRAAGVARVQHVRACTICDERFFSHRREGARAGRQAGVAWLS